MSQGDMWKDAQQDREGSFFDSELYKQALKERMRNSPGGNERR